MMISPQGYYDTYLKGKTADELLTTIRSLKREINYLKKTIEHPEYQCMIHPSESTKILCNRMYLEQAKKALLDSDVEYKPSKAEKKALEFNDNVSEIERIVFAQYNAWGLKESNSIIFADEDVVLRKCNPFAPTLEEKVIDRVYDVDRDELFDAIKGLYIGEWRAHYDLKRFDYYVLDGNKWDIIVKFKNGKRTVKKTGLNAYPYNFEAFKELFEIDEEV